MSIIDPLCPEDFPVVGQSVYRRTCSSPFIGPVSVQLANDIAMRLNRDYFGHAATTSTAIFHVAHPKSGGGHG